MWRNFGRLLTIVICGIVLLGASSYSKVFGNQSGTATAVPVLTDNQDDTGFSPVDVGHSVVLDKIRGSLQASIALWKAGNDLAKSHAADAQTELATINSDLTAQNEGAALKTAIDAYAALVGQANGSADAEGACQTALDAADVAEQTLVGSFFTDTQFQGEVIINVLAAAQGEYASALKDPTIAQSAHYQNAVAYLQVAQSRWDVITPGLENPDVVAKVQAQFDILAKDLPDYVNPPSKLASPADVKTTVDTLTNALQTLLDLPQATQEATASTP